MGQHGIPCSTKSVIESIKPSKLRGWDIWPMPNTPEMMQTSFKMGSTISKISKFHSKIQCQNSSSFITCQEKNPPRSGSKLHPSLFKVFKEQFPAIERGNRGPLSWPQVLPVARAFVRAWPPSCIFRPWPGCCWTLGCGFRGWERMMFQGYKMIEVYPLVI